MYPEEDVEDKVSDTIKDEGNVSDGSWIKLETENQLSNEEESQLPNTVSEQNRSD